MYTLYMYVQRAAKVQSPQKQSDYRQEVMPKAMEGPGPSFVEGVESYRPPSSLLHNGITYSPEDYTQGAG